MKPYYQDASVTLYHGDCRDVLPILQPSSVSLVVTSPPYNQMGGVGKKPSGLWAKTQGGEAFCRAWATNGYRDDIPEDEYVAWQNDLFAALGAACSADASMFYNHQLRWRDGTCLHPVDWFKPAGWSLRQEIVWDRCGGMMFNARMFVRFDERILWFVRGKSWTWNQDLVGLGTIWRIAREQAPGGKAHPVEYPIALPSRCIAAASKPGDIVLDPFSGSGTTALASATLGRRAIGIEIEERYCEIAAKRIESAAKQGVLFSAPSGSGPVQTVAEALVGEGGCVNESDTKSTDNG